MRPLVWLALPAALLALAGSAAANHDRDAKFAGNWTIDPTRPPGGSLSLRLTTDEAGMSAFRSMGVIGGRCDEPSIWYVGTFKTPNDSGPVVGCTEPRVLEPPAQSFSGWYRSTNFSGSGGRIGKLDMPARVEGTFQAFFSAPGESAGRLSPVLMRFARHFAGDGAGAASSIRFSFWQTGPDDLLLDRFENIFRAADAYDRSTTRGSGEVLLHERSEPFNKAAPYDASGTITHTHRRRVGADVTLTLEVVAGSHGTTTRYSSGGENERRLRLRVRVTRSNDSKCRIGTIGHVQLKEDRPLPKGVVGSKSFQHEVGVFVCNHQEIFTNRRATSQPVPYVAKVVLRGGDWD
jgi:hypothetical protein